MSEDRILVYCPDCSARMKIKPTSLGKTIACPKCQSSFEAMSAEESQPEVAEESTFEDESAPRVKKKKKKRKPKAGMPVGLVIAGVISAFVVVIGAIVAALSLAPKPVKNDKPLDVQYVMYNHETGAFRCDQPESWKVTDGRQAVKAWAEFESGEVSIKISQSVVGSLFGDIAKKPEDERFEFEPVMALHKLKKDTMHAEFAEFDDIPDTDENFKTGFGPSHLSQFKAKKGFAGKLRGIRATLLGTVKQFDVVCVCAEKDFERYRPIFERVIKSITFGIRK